MIPRMAEPFKYADIVVTMGLPGFAFFTRPSETIGSPGNTAMQLAASGGFEPLHQAFDIGATCTTNTSPDAPVQLTMGDVLTLEGDHPHWHAQVRLPQGAMELEIACTDEATWFARFPGMYDHVGLAATYRGTVTVDGRVHDVEGPCSFEHAYGRSYARMPQERRLPMRFFNYEVLSLDDGRTLLIARTGAGPETFWLVAAWLKGGNAPARTFPRVEKDFEEMAPTRAPDGTVMSVPTVWTTRIAGPAGEGTLRMRVDTPLTYGLGLGYVAGYRFEGTLLGQSISGRGYLEYVDVVGTT